MPKKHYFINIYFIKKQFSIKRREKPLFNKKYISLSLSDPCPPLAARSSEVLISNKSDVIEEMTPHDVIFVYKSSTEKQEASVAHQTRNNTRWRTCCTQVDEGSSPSVKTLTASIGWSWTPLYKTIFSTYEQYLLATK